MGCSYYSALPDSAEEQGGCFAALLVNTGEGPAKVAVEYQGLGLVVDEMARLVRGRGRDVTYEALPNGEIPVGETAMLFLAQTHDDAHVATCPRGVTAGFDLRDAAIHGPGLGGAFHIRTSSPVMAYDMFPFGAENPSAVTSATLLSPVHLWEKDYVAIEANLQAGYGPFLQVVASEDETLLTFLPADDIRGASSQPASSPRGVPAVYALAAGQMLQFSQLGDFSLTGSILRANRPIGLWAGSACANTGVPSCDTLHQQIPPPHQLGSEYVAVRPRNRFDGVDENPAWHVVAIKDGTVLTYEPLTPEGAPSYLDAGQRVQFRSSAPFVVRTQDETHPLYLAATMESCRAYGPDDDCRGDPEFVNVAPSTRFSRESRFYADPSFPETNLVVIRARGASGFLDVSLDCAGVLSGWQAVGTSFEATHVDLQRGNFEPQGGCDNGNHLMTSDGPFTVTLWGWGSAATGQETHGGTGIYTQSVSYAYPVGATAGGGQETTAQ